MASLADRQAGAATFDVVVIGAGPAGLAAAASAGEAGASVALVDGAARAGGQYWRGAGTADAARFQHGTSRFVRLQQRIDQCGVARLALHHVQTATAADGSWVLHCVCGAEPRAARAVTTVRGRRLVLAAGAYDRQLPFPGWDLPGVMTAGGVQALLKGHGVAAAARVVVAGTGPFLLPVASGLLAAGVQVPAVVEANSATAMARQPLALTGAAGKLGEAAAYLARLISSGTPYRRRHAVVQALGQDRLEAVDIARLDRAGRPVPGSSRRIACDVLAVGWGFTPQLELPLQLGCATALGADGSLVVTVDDQQGTGIDGVWAAGELTGVGGADLALVEGEIAGRAASGGTAGRRLLARRRALRRFAASMHAAHPVPSFLIGDLPDDVLVCRCEEVPASAVRAAVREAGATDARTVKLLARTGMGWCQGRVCGFATAELTSRTCGRATGMGDLLAFAERPLTVPVRLGLLADPTP